MSVPFPSSEVTMLGDPVPAAITYLHADGVARCAASMVGWHVPTRSAVFDVTASDGVVSRVRVLREEVIGWVFERGRPGQELRETVGFDARVLDGMIINVMLLDGWTLRAAQAQVIGRGN